MNGSDDFPCHVDELPRISIYTIEDDFYKKYYDIDENCKCGNDKWLNSTIEITIEENNIKMPPRKIQRCSSCQEIRTIRLKKKYEKISMDSKTILKTLKKAYPDDNDVFGMLENMYTSLGKSLYKENRFQDMFKQVKKLIKEE